jgi:hypothetical protein
LIVEHEAALRRVVEFVSIPTVANNSGGLRDGAAWLRGRLQSVGFSTNLLPGPRAPFVFGRLDSPGKTTLAIYAMYDTPRARSSTIRSTTTKVSHHGPRRLNTPRPIANKAAIELFLTAVAQLRGGSECPSIVFLAEGAELEGSPGLQSMIRERRDLWSGATSVFWPRASQAVGSRVKINLAYRGMLGVTMTASGRASGRGPVGEGVHSQYRAWVDAPTWRLVGALAALATQDGDEVAFPLPTSTWQLPAQPLSFDPGAMLAGLGVAAPAASPDAGTLWRRLAAASVNVEFLGSPGPGVGLIQPLAAARLQFRLPPASPTHDLVKAIRAHLDAGGWQDIEIQVDYAIDGAAADPRSAVVLAAEEMYANHKVVAEFWPISTATAPTCAFAAFDMDFADGGLGLQNPGSATLHIDDDGPIAGVDRTIAGYATFLKAYARMASARLQAADDSPRAADQTGDEGNAAGRVSDARG